MQHDLCLASRAKRIYANAHTYHINSISVNSDQQTFLSADDLRINLWNLDVTDQSFNIVDIKPANMDDLTEVRRSPAAACERSRRGLPSGQRVHGQSVPACRQPCSALCWPCSVLTCVLRTCGVLHCCSLLCAGHHLC